ncbi:DUF882 domain-containing protein [Hoeflea sp. TYP-13]|uniref:DUF882 domain-containing protein n=1 Tax=Hoeflea sp. TYP-13 TaxID=3230023 RepID=UPI0034C627C8
MLKRFNTIALTVNQRRRLLAAAVTVLVCSAAASPALSETRSLKLYFVHTKERATITFKKNGRYVPGGLKKLNRFLRDWRQKESTKMDPRLFDLLWEVYRASGAKKHIHVVSAYRSPKTNAMLRKRSRGVAKNSQHIQGKAMDFYLPDVSIKKLRRIGMQFQVGGVGYYPKSGSPFVHLDVGSVRSWPRMDRKELSKVFPNGKTLHLPTDGKPLPGYNQALADYKSRVSSKSIKVAGGRSVRRSSGGGGNLLAGLFGRKEDEDKPQRSKPKAQTQVASVAIKPDAAPQLVETVPELAYVPTPQSRPAPPDEGVQIALASVRETGIKATPAVFTPRRPGSLIPESGGVAIDIPQEAEAASPVAVAALPATQPSTLVPSGSQLSAESGGNLIPIPQLRTGTADYKGTRVALAPTRDNPPPEVVLGALLNAPVMAKPAETPLTREEWSNGQDAAAGDGDNGTPQLAYVPRPGERPDVTSPEAQVLAAAFEQSAYERSEGEPATGIPVPTPSPFGAAHGEMVSLPPVQVALAPPTGRLGASDSRVDVFAPSIALPKAKGGRPSARDAVSDRQASVRTEPVLTENLITHRAFTAHTLAAMDAPVTAPQFVSSYMRSAPATVHVEGFSTENRIASADQFSGRAVNFMTVARFEVRNQ